MISLRRPLVAAAAFVVVVALAGCRPEPEPTPTVALPTPTVTASRTPTPTPTPSPTETVVEATCETIATQTLLDQVAPLGWVPWEWPDGASPFDSFPNGAPPTRLACTWGESPDLATDNVLMVAWTTIDPENSIAAQAALEAQGFTRIEEADGVYMAVRGEAGFGDAEGWFTTYYFTDFDVRWAESKQDASTLVKAPDDPR